MPSVTGTNCARRSAFGTHTPRLLSKSITAFFGATSVFFRSSTVRLMRAYIPGFSR